ncbi:proline-rich extensin-like protein EPR1 [Rosa rugosa]|uniref:proline-rich extensin-like protein EPR1 n=1 Tax=Rosa rugosa TaxID=74645 RepID=UPI002B414DA4|nr:proline-rich extensin-like protein EPR1 [Rosa rugosa]
MRVITSPSAIVPDPPNTPSTPSSSPPPVSNNPIQSPPFAPPSNPPDLPDFAPPVQPGDPLAHQPDVQPDDPVIPDSLPFVPVQPLRRSQRSREPNVRLKDYVCSQVMLPPHQLSSASSPIQSPPFAPPSNPPDLPDFAPPVQPGDPLAHQPDVQPDDPVIPDSLPLVPVQPLRRSQRSREPNVRLKDYVCS